MLHARKCVTAILLALVCAVAARGHEGHIPEDVAKVARDMTETATNFLASLNDEQRAKAFYELKNDERLNWHFIPKVRNGLSLKDMTPSQRPHAHALLASGLSARGFINAVSIATLEEILHEAEKGKGPKRDPEMYFVTIFGKPAADATWAWRFEGHHLALNFTVIKGKFIADGPAFMGSNPENILDGPRKGMRLLGDLCDCLLGRGAAETVAYGEAFARHAGIDPHTASAAELAGRVRALGVEAPASLANEDRDGWLDLLLAERVQSNLGLHRPVILYDYPASQAALARLRSGRPPVAERFELYVSGIELANGYCELADPVTLRERNRTNNALRRSDGKPPLPEESRLLAAMEAGMPQATGVALGFDRTVMLAAGASDIRQVLAFPFDRA